MPIRAAANAQRVILLADHLMVQAKRCVSGYKNLSERGAGPRGLTCRASMLTSNKNSATAAQNAGEELLHRRLLLHPFV